MAEVGPGSGRSRPLSQQLAPEEQILPEAPIPRDVLNRKSTRHQPLPEKHLPQYNSLQKQPQQQLAPHDPSLQGPPVPKDEIRGPGLKHDPLISKPAVLTPSSRQPARDMANHKPSPGQPESNGELPNDQVIPLEELPKDQQPYYNHPPPTPTVVDDQPLLRRPRRRRPEQKTNDNYNSKASLCIGIILIIIGILEIVLNIIGIVFQELFRTNQTWNILFYIAPGIWCSIFFILCGAFGVVSARSRATWAIVTHLVVATLASVFAVILGVLCGWGIYTEVAVTGREDSGLHLPSLIILCLMGFGALVALPLALCASILCCKTFCHKQSGSQS